MRFDVTCERCGHTYAINPSHTYPFPFDDEARCPKCKAHGRVHLLWEGDEAKSADLRARVADKDGTWGWTITDTDGRGATYRPPGSIKPAVGTCATREEAVVAAESAMRTSCVTVRGGDWTRRK